MSLATAGFFAAKWTTRIEEEWIRSLEKQRPELVGKLGVRRDSMRDANQREVKRYENRSHED